jgi:hypothetical protein
MDLKRAVFINVIIYLAVHIAGPLFASLIGIGFDLRIAPSPEFLFFGMLFAICISVIGAFWYFNRRGLKASAKFGFYFGLISIPVGFTLDLFLELLITITGQANPGIFLRAAYGYWLFGVMLVCVPLLSAFIGKIKSK